MVRPSNLSMSTLPLPPFREDAGVLLVIHGVYSGISILFGSETDETESTTAVGITVLDDDLRVDVSYNREEILKKEKKKKN